MGRIWSDQHKYETWLQVDESTRTVSGIVEKTYAASASRLAIDRAVLAPAGGGADEGLETMLAVVLDEAKAEIRRGVRAGAIDPAKKSFADGGLYLGRIWMRLSPRSGPTSSPRASRPWRWSSNPNSTREPADLRTLARVLPDDRSRAGTARRSGRDQE